MEETEKPLDSASAEVSEDNESTETSPADVTAPVDIDALIAEAEERGYRRGRNEQIENLMGIPPEMSSEPDKETTVHPEVLILNYFRPSIWDM